MWFAYSGWSRRCCNLCGRQYSLQYLKKQIRSWKQIRSSLGKTFKYFHKNGIKARQNKCHLFSSFDITAKLPLLDCSIENRSCESLLGLIIDRKYNFNEHTAYLGNKASKKIQVVALICPYMPLTQRRLSMNACLFLSVLMNHSKILNNCINGIHERGLRGNVHTQIVTLNVKMTFLLQLSHAPLKLPLLAHGNPSFFIDRYDWAFEFCSRKFWQTCATFWSEKLWNNLKLE